VAIEVTVKDTETGESEKTVIWDDYVLTVAGACYLHHVQSYKNGTHVLTIKGRK
jgi:hypothetical protein